MRGEGDDRGWDGWLASLTQWTWVWATSERCWRTGKPGVLQSMGSQRIRHNLVTEQQQQSDGLKLQGKIHLQCPRERKEFFTTMLKSESESHSVVTYFLRPVYSPWNSLGQNTGVGSLSLLQGNLLNPWIEPRSPALQGDSLPAELSDPIKMQDISCVCRGLGWTLSLLT